MPVTEDIIEYNGLLFRAQILRRDDHTNRTNYGIFGLMHEGIRSTTLHGHSASAAVEEPAEDMAKLR